MTAPPLLPDTRHVNCFNLFHHAGLWQLTSLQAMRWLTIAFLASWIHGYQACLACVIFRIQVLFKKRFRGLHCSVKTADTVQLALCCIAQLFNFSTCKEMIHGCLQRSSSWS